MQNQPETPRNKQSPVARQLIVCAVAIGIMGAGVWSLMGQNAPYHPDAYGNEVSRDGNSGMLTLDEAN